MRRAVGQRADVRRGQRCRHRPGCERHGIAPGTYVQSVVGSTVNLTQGVSADVPSGTTITLAATSRSPVTCCPYPPQITGGVPTRHARIRHRSAHTTHQSRPVQYGQRVQTITEYWTGISPAGMLSRRGPYTRSRGDDRRHRTRSPYHPQLFEPHAANAHRQQQRTVDGHQCDGLLAGSSTCIGTNNQFGWYENLPSSGNRSYYNPVFQSGAFQVNPWCCEQHRDVLFEQPRYRLYYQLAIINGGVFTNTFPKYTGRARPPSSTDAIEAGRRDERTGSVYNVTSAGAPR